MTGISIPTIILVNTDAHFVISVDRNCVEDSWDSFPRLHIRTQRSRVTAILEQHSAPSWTSEKQDSECGLCHSVLGKGRWVLLQKTELSNWSQALFYIGKLCWDNTTSNLSWSAETPDSSLCRELVNSISTVPSRNIHNDKKLTQGVIS